MYFTFPTYNVPFTLVVKVKTKKPECIVLQAYDVVDSMQKINGVQTMMPVKTGYVNRKGIVNGERTFELKFPQVPSKLNVDIFNKKNGKFKGTEDPTFTIEKFEAVPLKTKPVWLSERDRNFIKFVQFFCENASHLSATQIVNGKEVPSVYRSDCGEFTFDYWDKIKDRKTGRKLNTPARIGHATGTVEISKEDFLKYTVPMRMVILLHEYSHKWKNPEDGNAIGYETGADINALNIYLSLGYSEIEAHQAFLFVFKGAATEGNHKRYLIIKDFIKKFHDGDLKEYAKAA